MSMYRVKIESKYGSSDELDILIDIEEDVIHKLRHSILQILTHAADRQIAKKVIKSSDE